MADIADVMDAMERVALTACYPLGTSSPSVTGKPIDIAQGWVIAEDLDKGLQAGTSFVSIYAVPSSTSKQPVPLTVGYAAVLTPPSHGMTAVETNSGFALYGVPNVGEYATVIVDQRVYSVAANAYDSAEVVAAYLAYAIAADFPGATWVSTGDGGTGVTIPGFSTLIVRIGAPGRVGAVIDRQRQNIIIGVWAPNPSDRSVIGAAIKIAIAQNLTVEMPDSSRSIWIAQSENLIDKNQNELAYRRDLTVQAQWDTVDAYDAYEVTSVTITQNPGPTALTRVY